MLMSASTMWMIICSLSYTSNNWVRNLKDRRVEAVLEGDSKSINSVIEWTRIGPANSRVDDIEVSNEEFKNEFSMFDVLY